MIYKNFDGNITRKHGIVIEGWPLRTFGNPSTIGSQVELKVLLSAWKSGATRFRKMSVEEHMKWVEAHADFQPPSTLSAGSTRMPPPPPPPVQNDDTDLAPATNLTPPHMPFIQYQSPAVPSTSTASTPSGLKKPRKTRSDKGKPRNKTLQIPGANVFSTTVS